MPDSLTPQMLKELAAIRVQEANLLVTGGFYDGACYLCGYVVELALKAIVCKTLDLPEYPLTKIGRTFRTHLPQELLLLAGLQTSLDYETANNQDFADNWAAVTRFGPDDRYSTGKTQADAQDILEALNANPNGVLLWLSHRW